jgi:hypothetical protein
MIRTLIIFFVGIFTISPLNASSADIVDELSVYFKKGDFENIAKKFASSVEININNDENVYSKLQGEQILKDYFQKHSPQKSTVHHKIDTNPNFKYCVLTLITSKGEFRVSVTLKKSNNDFFITELSILPGKE